MARSLWWTTTLSARHSWIMMLLKRVFTTQFASASMMVLVQMLALQGPGSEPWQEQSVLSTFFPR